MKNLFLTGLAIILFTACQKQEQRYFAESAETNILKAGIAAYEKGDWDTWKGYFADTAKIFVNSRESINVDARLKDLKESTATLSSYGFDKEEEYIEMVVDKKDEKWVYYWAQWTGTLAANSKTISVPVHLAVQFTDEKITKEHIYFDGTEMNKAYEELATSENQEKESESE